MMYYMFTVDAHVVIVFNGQSKLWKISLFQIMNGIQNRFYYVNIIYLNLYMYKLCM